MATTPLVFVDIDGVLNALPFLEGRDGTDWSQLIDHRAVARLNTLIDRSSAKVVISSSWRCHMPIVHIESLLRAQGFLGEILGATPRRTPNRGAEIQAWIDAAEEEPEALVILDDLDEAGSMAAVKAAGKARLEGKDYVMQDGDVVEFRSGLTSGGKK